MTRTRIAQRTRMMSKKRERRRKRRSSMRMSIYRLSFRRRGCSGSRGRKEQQRSRAIFRKRRMLESGRFDWVHSRIQGNVKGALFLSFSIPNR